MSSSYHDRYFGFFSILRFRFIWTKFLTKIPNLWRTLHCYPNLIKSSILLLRLLWVHTGYWHDAKSLNVLVVVPGNPCPPSLLALSLDGSYGMKYRGRGHKGCCYCGRAQGSKDFQSCSACQLVTCKSLPLFRFSFAERLFLDCGRACQRAHWIECHESKCCRIWLESETRSSFKFNRASTDSVHKTL